jgi:hypothetical protein
MGILNCLPSYRLGLPAFAGRWAPLTPIVIGRRTIIGMKALADMLYGTKVSKRRTPIYLHGAQAIYRDVIYKG